MGWEYGKWQRGCSVSEWHQTFIRVLKRASRPDGRCTVKCMLQQKGAVNYCGCISRIEGAYIRIVGASAPTKRYKITPLELITEMLNSLRPHLSQSLRNRVRHGVNLKKCVQNNRHCWRGSFLAHNISLRPQNNKAAK